MRNRDAWLFATFGWDPTWQRRIPGRAKLAWTIAVALVGAAFGALALISAYLMPRQQRWIPLAIMVFGILLLRGVEVVLRRAVLDRLDTEDDQRAAQRIQSRLLPTALPRVPGIELACHYSPFRLIGGDYYDAVRLGESHLLVAIADVSGKGTPAALLAASLQAILHFAQSREHPPETVAAAINAHLVRHTEPSRFVTMVLGVLDLGARRMRYVNAGHSPPLGVAPDGNILRLEATGLPLGMLETSTYTCAEVEVPAGTALLLYTDGLSERANPSQELFGEERILAALREATAKPAQRIVDALLRDVDRFAEGVEPEDDTALLVVRSL